MEPKARSTGENASRTARIVESRKIKRCVIVSKNSHLKWAMPLFKQHTAFRDARAVAAEVTRREIIAQMRAYLKVNKSPRVQRRLDALVKKRRGTD